MKHALQKVNHVSCLLCRNIQPYMVAYWAYVLLPQVSDYVISTVAKESINCYSLMSCLLLTLHACVLLISIGSFKRCIVFVQDTTLNQVAGLLCRYMPLSVATYSVVSHERISLSTAVIAALPTSCSFFPPKKNIMLPCTHATLATARAMWLVQWYHSACLPLITYANICGGQFNISKHA